MLYIAYNRAIRDEAATKFPRNVACKTSHQLAFHTVGRNYAHKLVGNLRITDIAHSLNVKNWKIAADCLSTLKAFLCSADTVCSQQHFEVGTGQCALTSQQERYVSQILSCADAIWQRMTNPSDSFPMTHDGYLKLYQLSQPNLSNRYQVILFDEAQDANEVTSDIVTRQLTRIILVGDTHQQIYRFRGAQDAMNNPLFEQADVLLLTHSFRFGPNIAMVANAILELKNEQTPVIGRGKQDFVSNTLPADVSHRTVLHRTVMGVIQTALANTNSGFKVSWAGGIESYNINYLEDIYFFSIEEREQIRDQQIVRDYEDYSEYVEIAQATKDSEMLRAIAIIKAYDALPEQLRLLKRNTVVDESLAHVTVSTAHRSKGLEWPYVELSDDFPDIFDPEMNDDQREDEINLIYVASTRATTHLALNSVVTMIINHITQKRRVELAAQAS